MLHPGSLVDVAMCGEVRIHVWCGVRLSLMSVQAVVYGSPVAEVVISCTYLMHVSGTESTTLQTACDPNYV